MIRLISGLGRAVIEFGEDAGQVAILLSKAVERSFRAIHDYRPGS